MPTHQSRVTLWPTAVLVLLVLMCENCKGIYGTNSSEQKLQSPNIESAENYPKNNAILYDLIHMANGSMNSVCNNHLELLKIGIQERQPWAIKVLDASAVKSAGFIYGNTFWLGSRELCDATQHLPHINFPSEVSYTKILHSVAPFDTEYRLAYVRINSSWQMQYDFTQNHVIHMGLCLPRACTNTEVQALVAAYVESEYFVERTLYDLQPQVIQATDLKLSERFKQKRSYHVMAAVLCFTITMMVWAAILSKLRSKPAAGKQQDDSSADAKKRDLHKRVQQSVLSYLLNFIDCFNIQRNFGALFRINNGTGGNESTKVVHFAVVNGLHTISAVIILGVHMFSYTYFATENKTKLARYINNGLNLAWIVDIFFSTGGFLHVYIFLQNAKLCEAIRRNNWVQNTRLYFNLLLLRVLRFVPLYYFVLLLADLIYSYIGEVSPFYMPQHFDGICEKYMWRHMLFIHNIFAWKEACINWSWSLACDVQFSNVASILLILYVKKPKLIKVTLGCLLLLNIVVTFAAIMRTNYVFTVDVFTDKVDEVYTNPVIRSISYLLGCIMAGYLLQHSKHANDFLRGRYFQILALFIAVYGFCEALESRTPTVVAFLAFLFKRLFVVFNVFWLLRKSIATPSANYLLRFLEAKLFQHFSRLTFAIYLLHPLFIAFFLGMSNGGIHFSFMLGVVLYPGVVLFSYLIAVLLSLTIEMPYKNLCQLLMKRQS